MALDVQIGALEKTAAAFGRGARDGFGGERDFAVAVDSGGRRQKSKNSKRNRAAVFFVAGGGGQFDFEIGATTLARKFKRQNFQNCVGAAGIDANRPRFLRTFQRDLRELPVS